MSLRTGAVTALVVAGFAPAAQAGDSGCGLRLVDPVAAVEAAWSRHDYVGHSRFRNTVVEGVPVIEAVPDGASGLYRQVDVDTVAMASPVVSWRWRVDHLQPSADLRQTETEDFSAVLFFLFGEPTLLHPTVPTLAYAWTATPVATGSLIRNPRHPDSLVTIKLEGTETVGSWRQESRNLRSDYRAAFGRDATEPLRHVALFSDNDQTHEPALAYYGTVTISECGAAPTLPKEIERHD